jgi:hypothetical protein
VTCYFFLCIGIEIFSINSQTTEEKAWVEWLSANHSDIPIPEYWLLWADFCSFLFNVNKILLIWLLFVQLGPLFIAQTLHVWLGHVLVHSLPIEGMLLTLCAPLGLYKGVIHSSFSSSNNHTQTAILYLCMSCISYCKFRQKYFGTAVICGREVDLVCDFGQVCHMLAVLVLGYDAVIWQICTSVFPKCWYLPNRPWGVIIKWPLI